MARTLLIVDDHRGLDIALGHLLARDGWDEVVQADTAARALALVNRRRPELVLTELRVGTEDGLDLLRALRADHPHLPLCVLTGLGTPETAAEALRIGATGFLTKSMEPEALRSAVRIVADGHTFLPVELVGPVVDLFVNPPPEDEWKQLVGTLSDRERQVLELMVTGLDRREIAEALTISLNTVRTHVKNILARVGVHSSLEAVSLALRAGMRPAPHPLAGGGRERRDVSSGRAPRS